MKKTLKLLLLLTFSLACCIFALASFPEEARFPSPEGFVNDCAGVLSEGARAQLEHLLRVVEQKTTAEAVVVTVETTSPLEIEQYAVELFQKWGIGKKGSDNGVLILVASGDRKVRIEVGYGLEGAITDLYSKAIISDLMIPSFKKGDFDGGVSAAVVMIAKGIADEYGVDLDLEKETAKLPVRVRGRRVSPVSSLLTFLFFVLIFGFRFGTLFFLMSRRGRYWTSGTGGSFGGGFGGFGGGFGGFGGGLSGGGGASGSW